MARSSGTKLMPRYKLLVYTMAELRYTVEAEDEEDADTKGTELVWEEDWGSIPIDEVSIDCIEVKETEDEVSGEELAARFFEIYNPTCDQCGK